MKLAKLTLCALVALALSLSALAFAEDAHYPVTITTYDYAKTPVEITFNEKPTRAISGQEIWNEMMFYFDLDEYMVAIANSDSNVPEEYKERYDALPKISDSWHNKEGIVSLEPQVFFGWRSHFAEDSLGDIYEWIDRDIQPVVLNCSNNACGNPSVQAVLQDFDNLGKIFDIQDKTDAYIAEANAMLDSIQENVAQLEAPKTVLMLEYYDGDTTVYAWGTNSLSGQMITNAGAVNPIDMQGDISLEEIVAINPDKIILMNAGNSDTEEDRESIYNAFYALEGLRSVEAVKNEQVRIYPLDDIYGGGIRIIPAIEDIYNWIYAE
ncbi:MAG: ABC transporter substrate-binding protein [Clostridia bacterium]|nr:ABC transporter substrate-binding protein [Clostridia bacterium]